MLITEKGTRERETGVEHVAWGSVDRPEGLSRYVIARRTNGALELLLSTSPVGGEVLPVFTVEQAAWRYLLAATSGAGWYVRKSRDGELASMLMCLCSGVESILLNPDPGDSGISIDREDFLRACLSGTTTGLWTKDAALVSVGGGR